ncbi:MAG: hypothetical protein M5R36_14770 [Deltaproteobacteria bacterium]|nr:hypothetical protein [Deltaproteobacteria bacterium]
MAAPITIERTSPCPECKKPLPTAISRVNGSAYLERECPDHGADRAKLPEDPELYARLEKTASKETIQFTKPTTSYEPFAKFVTTIAIDVTNRCNLECPNCFSVSGPDENRQPEISVETVRALLPDLPRGAFRPNVALVGGESLLRPDLPEIIRVIREKG